MYLTSGSGFCGSHRQLGACCFVCCLDPLAKTLETSPGVNVKPTSLKRLLSGWEESDGRCNDDRGVGLKLMPQATKIVPIKSAHFFNASSETSEIVTSWLGPQSINQFKVQLKFNVGGKCGSIKQQNQLSQIGQPRKALKDKQPIRFARLGSALATLAP